MYAQSKNDPAVSGVIAVSSENTITRAVHPARRRIRRRLLWCVERVRQMTLTPTSSRHPRWDRSDRPRLHEIFNPDNVTASPARRRTRRPALFRFGEEECGDGPRKLPVMRLCHESSETPIRPSPFGRARGRRPRLRERDAQLFATSRLARRPLAHRVKHAVHSLDAAQQLRTGVIYLDPSCPTARKPFISSVFNNEEPNLHCLHYP